MFSPASFPAVDVNADVLSRDALRGCGARPMPGPALLTYRGIRRQEDRDSRPAMRAAGAEKTYWHMLRIRIPLGTLTAEQYLALDRLSERVTYNRSLRATAGQSLQLHGLAETELEDTLAAVHRAGLGAGCSPEGLEYAVTGPPVPLQQTAYQKLRRLGAELCAALYPTPWTDVTCPGHAPRKFTIGLALPEDNSANVYANDVGLVLVDAAGPSPRVNILVGGGLSMPGHRPDTYARIGTPLGSVPLDRTLRTVRGIVGIFREHGRIASRRFARLKYVVDELGTDDFRRRLEERLNARLAEWIPLGDFGARPWLGRHDQGDGRIFYGLKVPNGRIIDVGLARYKTALRALVEAFRPKVIVTPTQDLILANLQPDQFQPLERILATYHVPFGDRLTPVRSTAMACAGLPTCSLALAESERVSEVLLQELERELARVGRRRSRFVFRISGCSIGCIRPNMVDLGAVGRKPDGYDLFVGGDETSGRFGQLYAEKVPLDRIIPVMRPLLEHWGRHGREGESFSAFYQRSFGHPDRPTHLTSVNQVAARPRVEEAICSLANPAQPFPVAVAGRELNLTHDD